jgi:hypothetical protein
MSSVSLKTLKELHAAAMDLQTGLFLHLEDETINRAMKSVVQHLQTYVIRAAATKTKSLPLSTTEVQGHDDDPS